MTKKSKIARNAQRTEVVSCFREEPASLKAVIKNPTTIRESAPRRTARHHKSNSTLCVLGR